MKSYTRYICVDKDNNPQGVDSSSGGYPWTPIWNNEPAFGQVQQYWTREAAKDYARITKLNVRRITITVEDE